MAKLKSFNAYFDVLNVGPVENSLEWVAQLQQAHIANLCFNSLSVLLDEPISLDIADIYEKLVIQRRGGYCFEHNKLMHDVLLHLGFNVRILVAKVVNNQPVDSPRTHRITLLEFQGESYLVDAGFSANSPRAPIKLDVGIDVTQGSYTYRLIMNAHQDYQLELKTDVDYFSFYTFNLQRYTEADCVMGNFYSCQFQKAVFKNNLVLSLIKPDVTLSVRNTSYHRIGPESTSVINIEDDKHLRFIISTDFGITLSEEACSLLYRQACLFQMA